MRDGRGVTTVYADASFCPETRAAGWGAWAKSDLGTRRGGGPINAPVRNAFEAEWCAMANGALLAHAEGIVITGSVMVLTSDCLEAVRLVAVTLLPRHKLLGLPVEAHMKIRRIAAAYGCKLIGRHVKGHTGGDDPRSYVNRVCDEEAYRHMAARREEIRMRREA